MVIHQGPKEEFCRLATVLGTKEFVVASLTQEFRDERIGVVGTQVGVASLQWVYLLVVIEIASHPEVSLILGEGIEFIHRLVESTELIAYHLLASFLREWFELVVSPVTHAFCHLQGFLIAHHLVLVYQALHDFMERIERCPHALALDISVDESFCEGTQIAPSAVCQLHLG